MKVAFLSFVCLLLTVANASSAAAASPEIYWSAMDYTNRVLIVRGVALIGGSAGNPDFPVVSVGGKDVAIDEGASVGATNFSTGEGSLIVPFNAIVSALPELVETTANGDEIRGDSNFALKVATAGSVMVRASLYFPEGVQQVLPPPPPPPSSGTCPCSVDYVAYYQRGQAEMMPVCTTPQSSSPNPVTGPVPVDQFIEASYLDWGTYFATLAIGSDSSTSSRTHLRNTCHVRTDSNWWPLVEGSAGISTLVTKPISDADHQACIAEIIALEQICSGGSW